MFHKRTTRDEDKERCAGVPDKEMQALSKTFSSFLMRFCRQTDRMFVVREPRSFHIFSCVSGIDLIENRQSCGALAQRYTRFLVVVYDLVSVNLNFVIPLIRSLLLESTNSK